MSEMLDHDRTAASRADRELTLGTGTILGMFLGLLILCGACFGVGYTMGHKAQPTPLALNDTSADASLSSTVSKPSAGSPLDNSTATVAGAPTPNIAAAPSLSKPAPVVRRPPPPHPAAGETVSGTTAPAVTRSPELARAPTVKPVPPSALMPSASSSTPASGSIMVQIAAVSHREDADLLVGALHARGYTVAARPSPGDNLIHVQIGPFSNKTTAEAMRQRLIGDGYNAMLKY